MGLNTHVEIPVRRLRSRPLLLQAGRYASASTDKHRDERCNQTCERRTSRAVHRAQHPY